MDISDKLNTAATLIIVLLLGVLAGNYLGHTRGFEQGQRAQDKVWCSALENAGVRMKGFPPCD